MTLWTELIDPARPSDLPSAKRHQVSPGVYRYAFAHDDVEIIDASHDASGELFVSPRDYGFAIRALHGGRTAWARDFSNGTMLLSTPDGQSHVLSPRFAARIIFVGLDGTVLQDTGVAQRQGNRPADLLTLRLTVNVTVDLDGASPEEARAQLVRLLDTALVEAELADDDAIRITEHAFEQVAVHTEERGFGNTDFSQLLDL